MCNAAVLCRGIALKRGRLKSSHGTVNRFRVHTFAAYICYTLNHVVSTWKTAVYLRDVLYAVRASEVHAEPRRTMEQARASRFARYLL